MDECHWLHVNSSSTRVETCKLYLNNINDGLVVSMLASDTQDRGFDPGRSRWIFRGKKTQACIPWGGGEVKPSPMSQICAAWVYVEVEITGKIDRPFLPRNSVFR